MDNLAETAKEIAMSHWKLGKTMRFMGQELEIFTKEELIGLVHISTTLANELHTEGAIRNG